MIMPAKLPQRRGRSAIAASVRFEVLRRDGYRCRYCGATPPDVALHLDHVVAVANGGTNDAANLVTACVRCNIGKGVSSAEPGGPKFEVGPDPLEGESWRDWWSLDVADLDAAIQFDGVEPLL